MRAKLKAVRRAAVRRNGLICHAANEIEGFLFKGRDAERRYHETGKFEYVSTGGYYHSLPGDKLRSSSTPPPKCSARWASATRRTTPRWRPASSR
jgi:hypothetical protein